MASDRDGLDELSALRLLVDNSADLLTRHAPDGTYLYLSSACRELLGYDPSELVGRCAYELFHPEDLAAITASHDEVLEVPDLHTVEYRIRHKQGHWVWLESIGHTVRDSATGEVREIHASSRDVSARRAADARLRESERRFRLSMANAPIGMALVGLDGSWLAVNDRLCRILGRSEDELRALTFQDITHPDDLDVDLKYLQQLLAGEIGHYSMEKRYFHADGHVVWILLSGSVVRDDAGQPLYYIAQIQDITERKRREQELRHLNTQLADSNAELERFASVASHDLRSPLTAVRGFLDLVLAHGGDLPGDTYEWLERAHHNTKHLAETVDALLELARVGHQPLSTEPVDLHAVIDDAAEVLRPQLDDADAHLDVQQLPTVQADRTQLRLVFQNLLANALKFRSPQRPLAITISATERDSTWELHLQDNGDGFDPDDAEMIFEPFARTTSGQRADGAGIGLATCRRIITRHGGSIHAQPLDPGARVTFTLPTHAHHAGHNPTTRTGATRKAPPTGG